MTSHLHQVKADRDRLPSWTDRKVILGLTPGLIILGAVSFISLGLHIYNIDAIGDANLYYTAAVESMLDSWSNFFFLAAEPGGSVSVDKPPLGLWIETVFAFFLGVQGWVVVLPNIIAGIASIPLLYYLVKKCLGTGPGVVAAAVMAFMPVVVATNRNNTMDSMLVLILLLAAWAFIVAIERGKLRYLLIGSFIVGLGFNVKMLQAFLPLPAFYALYFFASRENWIRKMGHLGSATFVLVVVSLSWAILVDSTAAEMRPYVGSSTDNTVMDLIFGHNGLNRLFGGGKKDNGPNEFQVADDVQSSPHQLHIPLDAGRQSNAPSNMKTSPRLLSSLPPGQQAPRDGYPPIAPPSYPQTGQGGGPLPDTPDAVRNQRMNEVGNPGWTRFFEVPLAKEMSWFLPFALISIVLAVLDTQLTLPVTSKVHKGILLWGGWLLTCLVFFSLAEFFHAYYMVMLTPALGGCIALGVYMIWKWWTTKPWLAGSILLSSGMLTLAFQLYLASQFKVSGDFLSVTITVFFFGSGIALIGLLLQIQGQWWKCISLIAVLCSLMVIPLTWSYLTVRTDSPNVNLPQAYAGVFDQHEAEPQIRAADIQLAVLDYVLANNGSSKFLLAVPSAQVGAKYVLKTGQPVLYMGGFNGRDEVVNANDLANLVGVGELEYVYYDIHPKVGKLDIFQWLNSNCVAVPEFVPESIQTGQAFPARFEAVQRMVLFQCSSSE
jgi:4-amino-4-deoxy-L-arabinose transferase-like glycosyltransferase